MLKTKSEIPLESEISKSFKMFFEALKNWTTAMPTPAKLNLRINISFFFLPFSKMTVCNNEVFSSVNEFNFCLIFSSTFKWNKKKMINGKIAHITVKYSLFYFLVIMPE